MGDTLCLAVETCVLPSARRPSRMHSPQSDTSQAIRVNVILIPSIVQYLSPVFEEELRWYMEDFPTLHPFQALRASTVAQQLVAYGSDLAESMTKSISSLGELANQHLCIKVNVGREKDDFMDAILWETLEMCSLWPTSARPTSVSVERMTTAKLRPDEALTIQDHTNPRARNILAITSRPQVEKDIPHRLITRPILDVVEASKNKQSIRFDIARPGTFEALKEALQTQDVGFYDVVHLDVHGKKIGAEYVSLYSLLPWRRDSKH